MIETLFGAELPLLARFAIALLFLVVVAILVWAAIRALAWAFRFGDSPSLKRFSTTPAPPVEIARITEHVVFSGGGAFAVVMLILFNVVLTVSYFAVTNVLQQNVALLSWIGWNILWGIGAIIGRRRTYIVHRTAKPSQ